MVFHPSGRGCTTQDFLEAAANFDGTAKKIKLPVALLAPGFAS
jgi:hypothetical protein